MKGPFTSSETWLQPTLQGAKPVFQKATQWYRQSNGTQTGHMSPLPYSMTKRVMTCDQHSSDRIGYNCFSGVIPSADQNARNAAYSKLRSKIADQSQWANNLLEMKEAVGSIVSAAQTLIKFTKAVRHGNFLSAAEHLGVKIPPDVRHYRKKQFSNNWLAYHFGWSPLMADIHAACETLTSEPPNGRKITGRGRAPLKSSYSVVRGTNNFQLSSELTRVFAEAGCRITISNPNAFLANQLGLLNPASIAWEAVPFSFVVDWFSNVGQVLDSLTDFVGLNVVDGYGTDYGVNTFIGSFQFYGNPFVSSFQNGAVTNVLVSRSLGVPGPTLTCKPFRGFGPIRGATAISLLIQQLK
jgi:hypothetical protein